jgi:hypothetical protein
MDNLLGTLNNERKGKERKISILSTIYFLRIKKIVYMIRELPALFALTLTTVVVELMWTEPTRVSASLSLER